MPLRKLAPEIHEKVWGSPLTGPWLANPEARPVGEIWFSAPEALPVLVKLLFTTERLSVQVHPGDAYAQAHGSPRGKTEMWHVLRSDLDASIAFGLRERVTKKRLREAAIGGEIVDMLAWIPAQAGDTFFVPAGTIHAIGSGLAICEIQQFSDVTYRLFDYQRQPPRPLHLDDGLAVAKRGPGAKRGLGEARRDLKPGNRGREFLAKCRYFRAERLHVTGKARCGASRAAAIYIAVAGEGTIAGEPFRAGEAWLVPAGEPRFSIESGDAVFLVAGQALAKYIFPRTARTVSLRHALAPGGHRVVEIRQKFRLLNQQFRLSRAVSHLLLWLANR
jgi:mannose-6-phosphate isomerase